VEGIVFDSTCRIAIVRCTLCSNYNERTQIVIQWKLQYLTTLDDIILLQADYLNTKDSTSRLKTTSFAMLHRFV